MGKEPEWPEEMKLTQARQYLGISFTKLTTLIKRGLLAFEEDPLDYRVKVVKRADLDRLRRGWRKAPLGQSKSK
jgi:hypothetical protein